MNKVLAIVVSNLILSYGLPVEHSEYEEHQSEEDLMGQSNLKLHQMANILMSPHFDSSHKLETTLVHFPKSGHEFSKSSHELNDIKSVGVHSSHLVEVAKDATINAALIPAIVSADAAAAGGALTAGAAIKGTVVGSAIATPIIVKAVALPGIAAGKTAALMSVPSLWVHKLGLAQTGKVVAIKAGAVGLAKKPLLVAKKIAHIAGRIFLKPIALIAGAHLKVIGTGLAIGGKLVGGTGAKIAKVGTVVKFVGLGHIGIGASAIGWGLDKSTIDTHFKESHRTFETNSNIETNY